MKPSRSCFGNQWLAALYPFLIWLEGLELYHIPSPTQVSFLLFEEFCILQPPLREKHLQWSLVILSTCQQPLILLHFSHLWKQQQQAPQAVFFQVSAVLEWCVISKAALSCNLVLLSRVSVNSWSYFTELTILNTLSSIFSIPIPFLPSIWMLLYRFSLVMDVLIMEHNYKVPPFIPETLLGDAELGLQQCSANNWPCDERTYCFADFSSHFS